MIGERSRRKKRSRRREKNVWVGGEERAKPKKQKKVKKLGGAGHRMGDTKNRSGFRRGRETEILEPEGGSRNIRREKQDEDRKGRDK